MTIRSPYTFVAITHSSLHEETQMRIHKFRNTNKGHSLSFPITQSGKIRIERLSRLGRLKLEHVYFAHNRVSVFYHLGYMGPLEDEEIKEEEEKNHD